MYLLLGLVPFVEFQERTGCAETGGRGMGSHIVPQQDVERVTGVG